MSYSQLTGMPPVGGNAYLSDNFHVLLSGVILSTLCVSSKVVRADRIVNKDAKQDVR